MPHDRGVEYSVAGTGEMTRRRTPEEHHVDRQLNDARKILNLLWGICDAACREHGLLMPALADVSHNADILERAASLEVGEHRSLACRMRLGSALAPDNGLVVELVVLERKGRAPNFSRVAIVYRTEDKSWSFYHGLCQAHSAEMTTLSGRLCINPTARVARAITEHLGLGLAAVIPKWAAEQARRHVSEK